MKNHHALEEETVQGSDMLLSNADQISANIVTREKDCQMGSLQDTFCKALIGRPHFYLSLCEASFFQL